MALLEVNDVHAYYGNIHALKGVSISVEKGEIVSLIGGNGAGKSTTLRSISGLMKPRAGTITLDGEDLIEYKAHQLAPKGIAMVPEGRGRVLQNVGARKPGDGCLSSGRQRWHSRRHGDGV